VAPKLSPLAIAAIEAAVDKIFARAKARFGGRVPPNTAKGLILSLKPHLSIPGLFKLAAKTEGTPANEEALHGVVKIGMSYLDATKEKAKAKMVHEVQTFITDAHNKGIDTDVETVLGGAISDLWGDITTDVKRIMETESTIARNVSLMDSISKVNLSAGISDPLVFFVVVRDNTLCTECKRLHVQPDGITPRVWRMSELGSGYHKKGQPNPKVGGLHPNCRCILVTLLPGYGFNSSGHVEYKSPGYDEYATQRGI
jgi:hypothetical protein